MDANIVPLESQRTTRKATLRLIELIVENYPKDTDGFLTLSHAGALDRIEFISQNLQAQLKLRSIPIYHLPPAIMTHAGPGVVCAQFFTL
jgi:fatty acid-binding protein DegV